MGICLGELLLRLLLNELPKISWVKGWGRKVIGFQCSIVVKSTVCANFRPQDSNMLTNMFFVIPSAPFGLVIHPYVSVRLSV